MIGGEGSPSNVSIKQDLKVLGSKVGSQTVQSDLGRTSGTGQTNTTASHGVRTGPEANGQTGSLGRDTGAGTKGRHDGSSNMGYIGTQNSVNAMTHNDDLNRFKKPGPLNITTFSI